MHCFFTLNNWLFFIFECLSSASSAVKKTKRMLRSMQYTSFSIALFYPSSNPKQLSITIDLLSKTTTRRRKNALKILCPTGISTVKSVTIKIKILISSIHRFFLWILWLQYESTVTNRKKNDQENKYDVIKKKHKKVIKFKHKLSGREKKIWWMLEKNQISYFIVQKEFQQTTSINIKPQ